MSKVGPFSVGTIAEVNKALRDVNYALQKLNRDNFETSVEGYEATNFTESRSIDASTIVLADLANVVATLIQDLIANGVISE